MCGIAGFITQQNKKTPEALHDIATQMALALKHRGPDDCGAWVDDEKGIALAHRRLSILDLSPLGHQPYVSEDKKYILSYNGEIYNFKDIRKELSDLGHNFKSQTDTEVLMKALMIWGVKKTLPKLNGMFAFAFYDQAQERIFLVRDRIGVKPLYWSKNHTLFMFSSELKAFHKHPSFKPRLNQQALAHYLQHGFMSRDLSIYQDVYQLNPGHMMSIDINSLEITAPEAWWQIPKGVSSGQTSIQDIHQELKKAVGLRMVADVPVGVMLSGGIDSSLITSLMQDQSDRPVKSFAIGFDEAGYNEAPHAEQIAAHLKTDHTTIMLKAKEAQDLIPKLADMYDEPFGDSSALPMLLLSKSLRQHVTVALSGDGGDEVFLGYNRYAYFSKLDAYRKMPKMIREITGALLDMAPLRTSLKDKVSKFTTAGLADNFTDLYTQIFGGWPASVVKSSSNPIIETPPFKDVRALQYLDFQHYLPSDIMTKVDRASMAYSLEARNPFLDVNVIETAYHLSEELKLNGSVTKYALRQILAQYVPKKMFERPKAGFSIPLATWLRGDLRDWANALFRDKTFTSLDFLDHHMIAQTWHEFLKGKDIHMHRIWYMLMFISWMKNYHKEGLS